MPSQRLILLSVLFLSTILSGCYNTPRRHLASDAILIEVGSSTRNDVLTYLGEPDKQRVLGNGREEWVFLEEQPSGFQRTPLVGGFFKGDGSENVFIVFQDDIVQLCQFRENAKDELDWADDYSWQETEE